MNYIKSNKNNWKINLIQNYDLMYINTDLRFYNLPVINLIYQKLLCSMFIINSYNLLDNIFEIASFN